jgi:hypothetical protein
MLTSPPDMHLRSVKRRCPVQLELPRFPPKLPSRLFPPWTSPLSGKVLSIPPFILDHERASYQRTVEVMSCEAIWTRFPDPFDGLRDLIRSVIVRPSHSSPTSLNTQHPALLRASRTETRHDLARFDESVRVYLSLKDEVSLQDASGSSIQGVKLTKVDALPFPGADIYHRVSTRSQAESLDRKTRSSALVNKKDFSPLRHAFHSSSLSLLESNRTKGLQDSLNEVEQPFTSQTSRSR